MDRYEKLYYETRKDKFGVIAKIKLDDPLDGERRTRIYRKEATPSEEDYRDLMRSGKFLEINSTDPDNKKWEWGTPSDYLGKGTKLMLFDRTDPGITVIADIDPKEAFYGNMNTFTVRNVMKPDPFRPLTETLYTLK